MANILITSSALGIKQWNLSADVRIKQTVVASVIFHLSDKFHELALVNTSAKVHQLLHVQYFSIPVHNEQQAYVNLLS